MSGNTNEIYTIDAVQVATIDQSRAIVVAASAAAKSGVNALINFNGVPYKTVTPSGETIPVLSVDGNIFIDYDEAMYFAKQIAGEQNRLVQVYFKGAPYREVLADVYHIPHIDFKTFDAMEAIRRAKAEVKTLKRSLVIFLNGNPCKMVDRKGNLIAA